MAVAVSAVSAITAAVGAWGTAAFIGAAATAAMETGLALTVIGAATGSKDLMKAGSVLGLAGGATGLAAGAGMFGEEIAANAGGWAKQGASSLATSAAGTGAETGALASPVAGSSVVSAPLESLGTSVADGGASMARQASTLAGEASPFTGLATDSAALPTGQAVGGDAVLSGAAAAPNTTALDPNAGWGSYDPLNTAQVQAPAAYSPNPVPPGGDPTGGQIGTGLQPGDNASLYSNVGYGNSTEQTLLEKLAKEGGDWWRGLGDMSKAMIVKSAMAIPGGIQAQANKAKELAMMQQRINQTSYGSQVPTFGIINKARGL